MFLSARVKWRKGGRPSLAHERESKGLDAVVFSRRCRDAKILRHGSDATQCVCEQDTQVHSVGYERLRAQGPLSVNGRVHDGRSLKGCPLKEKEQKMEKMTSKVVGWSTGNVEEKASSKIRRNWSIDGALIKK